MAAMVRVIINADDFGLNKECTRAICEAFQQGLITDTTMVANGASYSEALECIRKYQLENKIGIHFNLTACEPLSSQMKNCKTFVTEGKFHGKINRLKPLTKMEKKEVYEELNAQITKMEKDKIYITHADSHHHIHTAFFIMPIVLRVCKEHGVKKVRLHRNVGHIAFLKKLVKRAFNKWLSYKKFITTQYFCAIQDIEENKLEGTVEIMVHPDYNKQGELIDRKNYVEDFSVGEKMYPLTEYDSSIIFSSYYEV